MKDNPEREITIDDIIFITRYMDGQDYINYMSLPLAQRVEIARETLKGIERE